MTLGLALRSSAQGPYERSSPQKFEVLQGEHVSFGFVVSQPGLISVKAQSQGVPVIVSLSGPLAQPLERAGAGIVALEYNVTAADIARSSLWQVQVRPQGTRARSSPATQPQVTIIDEKTPRAPVAQQLRPVAWGTIAVQHPPGDLNRAKAELAARRRPQLQPAQIKAMAQQVLQQRKAQYLQAVAAAQAAQAQQFAKMRPPGARLSPSATQTQNTNVARIGGPATAATAGRGQAGSLQVSPLPLPPSATQTQSTNVARIGGPATAATAGRGQAGSLQVSPPPPPPPATQTQNTNVARISGPATAGDALANTTAASLQAVAPPPPPPPPPPSPPVISSLSVYHLQPGDWVAIKGSGFTSPTWVHFIVNPGMDVAVPVVGWAIVDWLNVQVPQVSGAVASVGQVYVTVGGQKSAPMPFYFNPTLDFAQLAPKCNDPDAQLDKNDSDCPYNGSPYPGHEWTVHHDGTWDVWGHKAEDKFYVSTVLRNGWVVDSVSVLNPSPGTACAPYCPWDGAGASVADSRVGTNSPYVDVHWWTDAGHYLEYDVVVNIKGPKGVPYQEAVRN